MVILSEIAPEPVQWLSSGRLALGKITVLDGDPGLGKSTLLCEFAARVTRGEALPGAQPTAPRRVVLLAAGPRSSKPLPQEAAAHGHAWRILARARRAENILIRKEPGRHGHWTWELPSPP
jgi:hypothetical protein